MASNPKSGKGKKVTAQASIGQQGVNFVEQIVLRMGSAWHAANASLDVGIDGEIELVNPDTREATNTIIRVQSKATARSLPSETTDTFEWPVEERDLDYWLSGNAPVILVISRPHQSEAYWVSVREYFNTPTRRKTKRVRFDKRTMRFTLESRDALFALAMPRDAGIYFAPRPREERIFSNLLTVEGLPDRLWFAETTLRSPGEVYTKLREIGIDAPEFVLRDKRILTVHDLTIRPWSSLVDRGTVEDFDVEHWANSDDPDISRRFVELLNFCLSARCRQLGCDRRRDDGMYYFAATQDLVPRVVPYRSVKDETKRTVFQAYEYKKGDRTGQVSYYRHSAFYGQFRRYDRQWYLEVAPTYFFSSDGRQRHRFYETKLKGIKALEKNGTILGQVVMWASLLRGRGEDEDGMFFKPPYPYLRFGQLATFSLPVGIDDASWLPNEERKTATSVSRTAEDLPLFQEPDPYADEVEEDVETEEGNAA